MFGIVQNVERVFRWLFFTFAPARKGNMLPLKRKNTYGYQLQAKRPRFQDNPYFQDVKRQRIDLFGKRSKCYVPDVPDVLQESWEPGAGEQEAVQSYDAGTYATMTTDTKRNHSFQSSIKKHTMNKNGLNILEIGPGKDAALTQFIPLPQTRLLTLIEANETAIASLKSKYKSHIRGGKVKLIQGYSNEERVVKDAWNEGGHSFDLLVAEILGNFASSEGFPQILVQASQQRLISDKTVVIPQKFGTLFIPADAKQVIHKDSSCKASEVLGPRVTKVHRLEKLDAAKGVFAQSSRVGLMEWFDSKELLQNGIKENQTNVNCFECIVQGGVQINCLACYIYCVTSAHDSSHRRRAYRGEQRPPSDCALLKKLDSKLYAQNQTVLGFTSAPAQTKWSTNSAQNWYKPVVWLPKTIILNMGDRLIVTCSVTSHFKPGIKTEYSFDVKVISNGVRKTQYSQQTTLKYDDIRPDMIQYNDGERQ